MASGSFLQLIPGTQHPPAAATSSFREWIRNTRGMFSSCSWVNTNPSGAIDPDGPNAFPRSAANTVSGYDVFRMNDAFAGGGSGSAPLFLRVDYSTSAAGAGSGSIYVLTIGSTHDGSGTVGPAGRTAVFRTNNTSFNASTTSGTCYFSGDSSSIAIAMYVEASSIPYAFYVERTRDATGSVTTEGFLAQNLTGVTNGDHNVIFYPNSATGSVVSFIGSVTLLGNNSPSTTQGRTNISHFYHFGGSNAVLNPGIMMLAAKAGDFAVNYAMSPVSVYGVTRNYIQLGPTLGVAASAATIRTSAGNNRFLMLFE